MTRPAPAPLPPADAEAIVDVLSLAEKLKTEMRHSWLSDGRRESVAEHSWLMSVAAVLMAPHLEHPEDLGQTLKLIALHDIAEAITGDIPFFEDSPRKATKAADEAEAMATMRAMLPPASGDLLMALWREYEECETPEARFARPRQARGPASAQSGGSEDLDRGRAGSGLHQDGPRMRP